MRSLPRIQHSGGFTLVELVISIALIGMLAAVGSNIVVNTFNTSRWVDADNANNAQARYALERLAREIREIKYDDLGNACIYATPNVATNMSTSKLAFYKTSGTYSATCATSAVLVTISNSLPNLTLGYSSPAVTAALTDKVSSFSLVYRDSNNCATSLVGNTIGAANCSTTGGMRVVDISLTVTDATSGQRISQLTRVALRNAG